MAKTLKTSTVKALAACHAVGLTYHAHLEGESVFWATDGRFYHVVRKRTTAGVTRAAHQCRSYRDHLSAQLGELAADMKTRLHRIPVLSREYTNIELTMVCPSWLCDVDDDFIEVGDTADTALSTIWLEGAPC
jgi:hypothetical protein